MQERSETQMFPKETNMFHFRDVFRVKALIFFSKNLAIET